MSQPRRIAALDGLRALAVLCVLVWHGFPRDNPFWQDFFGVSALGPMGVRLFFVLSGYLITKILLTTDRTDLWRFYARRLLRLSPLYFLALVVALLVGLKVSGWFWVYASNVETWITKEFDHSPTHFWTLAVEEQFYLFWPIVVCLLPRDLVKPAIIATLIGAVMFRWVLVAAGDPFGAYLLMPTRMDAIAIGGMCAAWRWTDREGWWLVTIGASAWLGVLALEHVGVATFQPWHVTASELANAVRDAGLVLVAAHSAGALSRCLTWAPCAALGRLSYGVYVWNPFVLFVTPWWSAPGWPRFLHISIGAIAISAVTWWLIERPAAQLASRHLR